MSKKIFVLFIIIALLIGVSIIQPPKEKSGSYAYHQHKVSAQEDNTKTGLSDDGVLSTHLPIIIIETNGSVIPGLDRNDKSKLKCKYSIIDSRNKTNSSKDTPTKEGTMLLSIRGNSSRNFSKKQYSLKLIDNKGAGNPQSLLGMPAESTWALNGSYIDKSQIRNYVIYNISSEFTPNVPKCRLCEVMITDAAGQTQYEGLYTLIEKPNVSQNRLKLTKYDPKYSETSFLLQMNSPIENFEIEHLVKADAYLYNFDLEYPDSEKIKDKSLIYIQNEVYKIEKSMLDASQSGDWKKVEDNLDMDRFVDYYIINEFFQNYDAGRRSTFLYKNLGGKFTVGPLWDFDGAFNNYMNLNISIEELKMKRQFYFHYLSKNPKFAKMCSKRYKELRKTFLSDEYLINYIDETSEYLGTAALRNCDRWYNGNYSLYYSDIKKMKKFVKDRGKFMDEHFETLSTVVDWKGAS